MTELHWEINTVSQRCFLCFIVSLAQQDWSHAHHLNNYSALIQVCPWFTNQSLSHCAELFGNVTNQQKTVKLQKKVTTWNKAARKTSLLSMDLNCIVLDKLQALTTWTRDLYNDTLKFIATNTLNHSGRSLVSLLANYCFLRAWGTRETLTPGNKDQSERETLQLLKSL